MSVDCRECGQPRLEGPNFLTDITGDGDYVASIPFGWQDETLTTKVGWRRNADRAIIAAIDAWRGRRRDWRQGVDW